jgi:hypothetical protein
MAKTHFWQKCRKTSIITYVGVRILHFWQKCRKTSIITYVGVRILHF